MIKIAYVIDSIETPSAGTEKQLLLLLDGLDKSKFQPYLICLHDSAWLKIQDFKYKVIKYNFFKLMSLKFFRSLFQFRKFLIKEDIDIVQTFFIDANIFGTIGAIISGRRFIISSRRNIGHWHTRFHILILRILKRWTSNYLANSKAAAMMTEIKEKVETDRIKVIYNGLDLEGFERINDEMRRRQRSAWKVEENETLIGVSANLRHVKNIDSLIEAASNLIEEFPGLRFVVAGEGPERNRLQTLIDEQQLSDKFHLAGGCPDIIPCLAAFDIGVLCSRHESFSNSLIEFMAAGLPIVASNVGGNGEAISHNQTGLLYSINDENGLENALRKLVQDRAFAAILGKNAKLEAFLKYSRTNCIIDHESYYDEISRGD